MVYSRGGESAKHNRPHWLHDTFIGPHSFSIRKFCLKNTQHHVANLLSIHAELFFTAKIRDFCVFFMPRKQHVVECETVVVECEIVVVECETVFKKSLRFLLYQFVVHLTKF